MLVSASTVRAYPPHLISPSLVFHNHPTAFAFLSGRVVINSFEFGFAIPLIQLAIRMPAGFAFAKIPFR